MVAARIHARRYRRFELCSCPHLPCSDPGKTLVLSIDLCFGDRTFGELLFWTVLLNFLRRDFLFEIIPVVLWTVEPSNSY